MSARPEPDHADPVDAIIEQWARVRPDLDTAGMEVFGRVYRLARAMGDRHERVYAPFGISRGEFDVLATLRRAGEPYTLSPRQLSATLMLTTGGMTGRLDKLERAGLLRRSPDPHDRRGLQVTLTEEGLRLIDEAVVAGVTEQSRALAALGPERSALLADLLRDLLLATER
ncbi:MarR family transcriptional regulator [Actinospica acidiphila]|uniref:MarR family transcriptional regulator n=1 Tax=Streptomyces griseoincarnatus TaxID=29305 RepID=A0ABT0VNY9_STRGI|nr:MULTISPECIES: MarR family transcriptional regulator [Streptomyces]MBJ6616582.1 MarR family transcriptional regulator [Streptomyces sp. I3(2020)]NEA81086.1 MarR family transcriptional regulator [Actinospica acidiphila]NUV55958.1 MarR family transcriptional regulator [Streptomyces coelicolor]PWE07532.1 MarR family transcriptional regulator [Streptomyces sp. BSE7F]MBJ6627298.1 MarR family transcriptional regulator [Streptomyces sp. I4(2020)]